MSLPLIFLIYSILVTFWIVPIVWLIFSSFQPSELIARGEIGAIFTLANYQEVFTRAKIGDFLINSITVALCATTLSAIIGVPAAYSMARWATGGPTFAFWILSSRMVPPAVFVVPFFIMFTRIGIIDTIFGLIVAHLTFSLAFVIWMSRIFIQDVPRDLEEAARVDGANTLTILLRIVLPVARPGILATLILNLIFSWNEYLFAFGLTLTEQSRTLPLVAGIFVTSYQIHWGQMFAAATIIMLPILMFAFVVQRYIIGGLTMGATK